MPSFITKLTLLAILLTTTSPVLSNIKYPTNQEIQGIKNICAGGDVQAVEAKLDAALKEWRNLGARLDAAAAKRNLGAVLEKVTDEVGGVDLYKEYVGCVQNLIEKYMQRSEAEDKAVRCKPIPTKVVETYTELIREDDISDMVPYGYGRPSCYDMKKTQKAAVKRTCYRRFKGRVSSWEDEDCTCEVIAGYWSCDVAVSGECEFDKDTTVMKSQC